jgi:replication factor A1
MSGTEDIIKRILSLKPNLTREAVKRLIDEERAKAADLLTEEAAAHMVASNMGIDGAGKKIETKLVIGDLTSGLNDVSITGRVIHVFPSRTFSRRDGREGKVARMIIGDRTGSVTMVLWDEKADHLAASKIEAGKIVRILHGYTRERRGEIEVNVGNRGQIFMEPLDAVEGSFPPLEEFFMTPADIHVTGRVNIEGVVTDKYPPSTFERGDGSEGKVSRLVLEEGGGRINLVLWDDKVDEFGFLPTGTRIRVISGSAREGRGGGPEVHISWYTEIEILEHGVEPEEPVSYWTKIGELEDNMSGVNVYGQVYEIGEEREFTRNDGSLGRVASILIQDETGLVRLTLWDNDVDLLDELRTGTIVAVENGYTKEGYGGIDLNVGRYGEICINPENVEMVEVTPADRVVEIQNLSVGDKNVTIQGQLLDDPQTRDVETSRGPARVTNFRIDDGTGEVRVSLWRELGEEVEGVEAGSYIRLENVNVREPFDGLLQISNSPFSRIEILRR